MTISLSINLNKIALVRNSREGRFPDVLEFARLSIEAGADGITVHPRPDGRHIRPHDVLELKELLEEHPDVEFNIEGNPFSTVYNGGGQMLVDFVLDVRPHQFTLVPDNDSQLTSDSGWNIAPNAPRLAEIMGKIREQGIRSSVFMNADSQEFSALAECGADRVELYTGSYAQDFITSKQKSTFNQFKEAARTAVAAGMEVNAGHDLNLDNLPLFSTIKELKEVSIGHALTVDALRIGFVVAVKSYKKILAGS